ncbi:phytanoyl-CoA dioxygenase family protein [Myxococcota bacterium]|nr:phytanoyl-CoA dioxygenase family protein [Myxococcota bacterium]
MSELRRHPLNTEFEWSTPPGASRLITPEQRRDWNERGCFLLEDAFDASTLERLCTELDPQEQRTEDFLRATPTGRLFIARSGEITFTPHAVLQSAWLRDFCAGPTFCDLVHDLIGPDVRLYWDQAVYKKPGAVDEFPWHQDNGYTFVRPQQYLTCWIALTDATLENGCPWIAPGRHRLGTLEHRMTDLGWQCLEEVEDAEPVTARAGSIVVFSSLTPHRTGPNTSHEVRKAYIVQFAGDGAVLVGGDGDQPCNAEDRQFRILTDGHPVRA